MKPSFSTAEIESIYREHPMRGEAILARVTGEMVRDRPLRESDLAGTGGDTATDQNHPGGAEYVRQLARLANIEPGCRVLDVGCGLGGSARILAEEFGCQVDGVELTETRYQDANRLTRLVGLDDRVRFIQGDFLSIPLPEYHYSVVWGQSAWVHFSDINALLHRCAHLLATPGRLAVEDAVLRRQPNTNTERRQLDELEECWACYLLDWSAWMSALRMNNLFVTHHDDLTFPFEEEMASLQQLHQLPYGKAPSREIRGCQLSRELVQAGVLGYVRFVAKGCDTVFTEP
jgi:SAM-dependent methyltransferase